MDHSGLSRTIGRKLRMGCSVSLLAGLFVVPLDLTVPIQSAWATTCSGFSTYGYRQGYTSGNWTGSEPKEPEGTLDYLNQPGGDILCSGDTNGGNNWVAAWNGVFSNGGNSGWVQSGTMYRYGWGCVENWAQTSQNGSSWSNWQWNNYLCDDNGDDEFFNYAYYTGSTWEMVFGFYDKNGTAHTGTTNFSPFSNWVYPYWAEYASESDYPVNSIPGTASNPEVNSFTHIQSYADNQWYDTCNNSYQAPYNNPPTNWKLYAQTCDQFQTWTS